MLPLISSLCIDIGTSNSISKIDLILLLNTEDNVSVNNELLDTTEK